MRIFSRSARRAVCLLVAAALAVLALTTTGSAESAGRHAGPINAKLSLDPARAAHATITRAAGGRLAVTAANGTRITVTFAADSVAADTLVTATPVTKLANSVLRPGLVAGVQLQPEGLRLLRPATVRFARRGRAHRGTRMVFVGSDGTGRDVHRLPPPYAIRGRGRQRRIVITPGPAVLISHFSTTEGFDWTTATVSEIDAISRPEQGEALLEQQIATLLRAKATPQEVLDLLDHALIHFIEPLLKVSSSRLTSSCSEANIRGAMVGLQVVLNFDRQVTLLGGQSSVGYGALGGLLSQTATCMTTLCPKLGDPRAGMYFLFLAHQLQVLGIVSNGDYFTVLYDNLEKCGAFELHLDSRIDDNFALSNFSTRVEGRVTYVPKVAVGGAQPRPRAPLTYTSTSGAVVSQCDTAEISATAAGEFELSDVQLSTYDPQHPTQDPVLSLNITVTGIPKETLHSRYAPTDPSCMPGEEPPDVQTVLWNVGFQTEHPDYTFAGTDFVRDTAPTFAIAVYGPRTTPFADGTLSENTLVELIHKPQAPSPLPPVDG